MSEKADEIQGGVGGDLASFLPPFHLSFSLSVFQTNATCAEERSE